MKKVWIIAGGVVVVAGLSAPWAVGKLTEQHWQSAAEQFNDSQPYFVMETDEYERGYLNSTVQGQLFAVDPDTGERHPIGWTGEVAHGVTSSTIDFDFDFPEQSGIDEIFPDEQPTLTVTTSAWGSSLVELNVPAIDYTDESSGESLNVSESYANMTVGNDGESLDVNMQWPGLVLRTPDMRVSMENFNLQQQAELLTGKLWTGDATVTLAKLSMAERDHPEVTLENLEMVSNSDADNDAGQFELITELTLENVRQAEESYGPHSLEFGLQGVSVAAWNELLESVGRMQEVNASARDNPQAAFERQMEATTAFTGSVEALMADGLSSSLDWDLSSPEGPVTGGILVSHPEQAGDEQVPLMMIMQTIEAEMNLKLPVALGERYPELGAELAPLVAQGALVEEGDFYVMEATLNEMMVNLNGNKMPLPIPGMGTSPSPGMPQM